ncbi:hypothetical protein [Clostridium tyrobutyricum]|uniref:hypothetical protein n=1 Tax=Clostridium tyrobutyricum TaxID=1519 RepID=UPI0010AB4879|nr:hypothetical protein [Clostridium tyrobutyricum]QCH28446.1 hypothetical protein EZN00_02050 [Clostridium tyrobutyricum]
MNYKILNSENNLRVEGYNEDGTIGYIQPFNSFTGKEFFSIEECKSYCESLGYDIVEENNKVE